MKKNLLDEDSFIEKMKVYLWCFLVFSLVEDVFFLTFMRTKLAKIDQKIESHYQKSYDLYMNFLNGVYMEDIYDYADKRESLKGTQ